MVQLRALGFLQFRMKTRGRALLSGAFVGAGTYTDPQCGCSACELRSIFVFQINAVQMLGA
jgi:hypothetical protein